MHIATILRIQEAIPGLPETHQIPIEQPLEIRDEPAKAEPTPMALAMSRLPGDVVPHPMRR